MAKIKTADIDLPERDHLVIPVYNRRDKRGFEQWYDALEPRIKSYWIGRKVRFKKENLLKEIKDASFHASSISFSHGNDTYLTTFMFEEGGDEYVVYFNYMYYDLFEIV